MVYLKKVFVLLFFLLFASFLCFYPVRLGIFEDWFLFLFVFLITSLGVFLFFESTWNSVRLKRRRKKKQHQHLFEALSEGIILLSVKGRILYFNRKAQQTLKLSRSKLVGKELMSLKHSMLLKKCQILFKRCRQTGLEQSISFCLEEGSQRSLDVVIKPLFEISRFLILIQYSTSHYQKHELGKDFVANASHELRTPITIIKGFAETLSELPEVSEAMFHDFTEKIIRNCQRMDQLVKNLLTLTDLDHSPQLRLQECDLVGLVDSCIYTLLTVYPDIHIQALQNKEVISIPADPHLLELALMNLLENGVKYSESPADLTITIEDRLEDVRLSIADKGKGIPPSDLPHIFERFYTVDKAHSRRLGGAGLGLSIVQKAIKKHEGKIEVFSEKGKGTEFILIFRKALQSVMHYCDVETSGI